LNPRSPIATSNPARIFAYLVPRAPRPKSQLPLWLDLLNDRFDRVASALRGGKLDFPDRAALAYKLREGIVRWIRGWGRPRLDRGDPLEMAMNNGDLAVIADNLLKSECDQRIITWLADQFGPPLPSSSRFEIKKPRKHREGESPDELFARDMHIGEMVARFHQQGGPFKTALWNANIQEKVSTSTARRAYQVYNDPQLFCADGPPELRVYYQLKSLSFKEGPFGAIVRRQGL
jgi:hypothetical protein